MRRPSLAWMALLSLGVAPGWSACAGDAAGSDTAAAETADSAPTDVAETALDTEDAIDDTAEDVGETHPEIVAETAPETIAETVAETAPETVAETTPDSTPSDTTPRDTTPIEARLPRAGDVWIAELQIDPSAVSDLVGEWVELENRSDALLDLASCWVDVNGARLSLAAPGTELRLGALGRLVVGNGAAGVNGGAAVDLVLPALGLPNAGATLAFGCGDTTLDSASWDVARDPLVPGRALVRAGSAASPQLCAARTRYGDAGERGTPGAPNDSCDAQLATSACELIAPTATSAGAGLAFPIVGRFVVPGETDFSPANDRLPRFRAEVGWAPGTDPLAWSAAEPFDAALDPAHADADTWGLMVSDLAAGPWRFGFRVSFDAGASWTNCTGTALTLGENPCFPNPCTDPPKAYCQAATAVATDPIGVCTRSGALAHCAYPERRTDCATLGGTCASGACVDVAGLPAHAGDLIVDEFLADPVYTTDANGAWIELRNLRDTAFNLSGCTLSDAGSDRVTVSPAAPLLVAPGALVVLGGSTDQTLNGNAPVRWAWGNAFGLDAASDEIRLECGGVLIDQVAYDASFPHSGGKSTSLDPSSAKADLNDAGSAWCLATNAWGAQWWLDKGTPGKPNAVCARAIDWCGLASDASIERLPGEDLEVAIQVREDGVTNRSFATDTDPLVQLEVGIGDPKRAPSSWSDDQFVTASPDPFWSAADTDEYLAELSAPASAAVYAVVGRATADGGVTWTYCDRQLGSAGGSSDGFAMSDTPALIVNAPDACTPNPCVAPPEPSCDELGTHHRLHDGACMIVPGTGGAPDGSRCDYADDATDCAALGGACAVDGCVGGATAPAPGEVIVSEFMAWPSVVADFFGEWIELTSLAGATLNLDGCELRDGDGGRFVLAGAAHVLLLGDGATVVATRAAAPDANGGVSGLGASGAWGGAFGLGNGGDTIALWCKDALIDAVSWDASWHVGAGVSLQLDPRAFDATSNDARGAWCPSATPYGDGDLGSPGAANAECP